MIDAAVEVLPVGLLVLGVLAAAFVASVRQADDDALEVRGPHADCTTWRAPDGEWWARCACGAVMDRLSSKAGALDWWDDHCDYEAHISAFTGGDAA